MGVGNVRRGQKLMNERDGLREVDTSEEAAVAWPGKQGCSVSTTLSAFFKPSSSSDFSRPSSSSFSHAPLTQFLLNSSVCARVQTHTHIENPQTFSLSGHTASCLSINPYFPTTDGICVSFFISKCREKRYLLAQEYVD